jgi:hypothetical protein
MFTIKTLEKREGQREYLEERHCYNFCELLPQLEKVTGLRKDSLTTGIFLETCLAISVTQTHYL